MDCFGARGRAEESFSFQWAKSPHLRHRRHGLHILRDDFFIYTKLPLKIKKDTVTQVSNDVENVPQSYIRNELASPVSNDNVTQNKASVNNTDTKFSLDVDRFLNDSRNAQLWQYDGYEHFSKQRNFIYRKGIFFFATQNKNETVALNAKDKISRGYINDELSRTDNIANNASNYKFMLSFLTLGSIQFLLTSYSVHFISGERLAPQKCCKRKKQRKQRRHSKCKSPCLNVRDECR